MVGLVNTRRDIAIITRRKINKEDVIEFTDIFYKNKHSKADISTMNNCVNHSVLRITDFNREETIDFKGLIGKFISLYMLIIQVAPIVDVDLHRLNIYLRFLIKKIEIEVTGGVNITDKVLLQYYKLEKKTEGAIALEGEDKGVDITVSGGGKVAEEVSDYLSIIIDNLNKKYGTNFSESEKLAVAQIRNNLREDKDLELKAQVNSYDVFKHAFEPRFLDGVIKEYEKNQGFYGRILKDEKFRHNFMELLMLDLYSSFKGEKNSSA
jgi:type I restriction enzyme R subunit